MPRVHVVKQGEYLDQIAYRTGLRATVIWEDAANAELRSRRKHPNMLAPGDLLHIPDDNGSPPLRVVVGGTNRFRAQVPKVQVSFVVQLEGKPVGRELYVIEGLVEVQRGSTDDSGTVAFAVPIDVREVRVVFPRLARVFPVRVGELDPADELSGVRQRLEHLGYGGWTLDGSARLPANSDRAALGDAIRMFQRDRRLPPTGVLDDDTRQALEKAHPI
ncbi:MAG: peptidoglycan-binding domain-containing protein [Polyangiaceae bacterium]